MGIIMNFCPNCGAEREKNANICPYCGFSYFKTNEVQDYKKKVAELEDKLIQLEKPDKFNPFKLDSSQMKYFWIMATIMVIAFFAFIFFFVFMARH
jgi:uncharacterized membrane protein YvbJ